MFRRIEVILPGGVDDEGQTYPPSKDGLTLAIGIEAGRHPGSPVYARDRYVDTAFASTSGQPVVV